MAMANFV